MTSARTTTPATGIQAIVGAGVQAPAADTATDSASNIFEFTPTQKDVASKFAEMSSEYERPTPKDVLVKGFRSFVAAERFLHARFYRAGALAFHSDRPSWSTAALADGYRKYPRMELLLRYAAEGDRFAKAAIDAEIAYYYLGHYPLKRHVDVLALMGFSGHVNALERLFGYLENQAADKKVRRDVTDRTFNEAEAARHCYYPYVLDALRRYCPRASEFPFMPANVQEFLTGFNADKLIPLAVSGKESAREVLKYLQDIGRTDITEKLAAATQKA